MRYKQLTATHRDMQFLEHRRWNREELSMVFGVPKWLLGVSADLNYATARSAERILWTGALAGLRARRTSQSATPHSTQAAQ